MEIPLGARPPAARSNPADSVTRPIIRRTVKMVSVMIRPAFILLAVLAAAGNCAPGDHVAPGFTDAASFGFSPEASGLDNTKALQRALERGGTVVVSRPGTYKVAGTIFLGSNTTLKFGNAVFLKKVHDQGPFSHVFVNKGASSRTWDEHIVVDGLQLIVNGVDTRDFNVAYGLHGQLAFFYARGVRIEHFRCLDVAKSQYAIQVCTFEDLSIHDVVIKGMKDGIHLGRGKRFTIRDAVFETYDDALALNGHDYSTGNPELGWIEDGVVENCSDLAAEKSVGYFCRILAGGWTDWKEGMEVQQSDTVAACGRLYRVQSQPDGKVYKSLAKPTHTKGTAVLDGIPWGVVQDEAIHSAGVRNVVFRDIFLHKKRTSFSVHFDNDRYSRSYYPGSEVPVQQALLFENIRILHEGDRVPLLSIATPVDSIMISNSRIGDNPICFDSNRALRDYGRTSITMIGCTFFHPGTNSPVQNSVSGKRIDFRTLASTIIPSDFTAILVPGEGNITVDSDLPGLKR
jgi:hypothetical protein